ncbi:hypothetical protein BC332_26238 [Capsicum chinense]|nr:hypothetical protein BC332_26238 [Capsicum chinense]
MNTGKEKWPNIISILKSYKPILHCHNVISAFPERDKMKCNIDGACRGNPRIRALAFCLRNERKDLIFAKARGVSKTTNIEEEALALRKVTKYYLLKGYEGVIFETDSLTLRNMVEKQWKVPWVLINMIEEIWYNLNIVQGQITYIFREGNVVADVLTKQVINNQHTEEYHMFTELPTAIKKYINMDKSQHHQKRMVGYSTGSVDPPHQSSTVNVDVSTYDGYIVLECKDRF